MHGAECVGPCTIHMATLSESRDILCLDPLSQASHMYVIKSVSKKSFDMDYLMSMWSCKYSHVVSCSHLTKTPYVEISIKGITILVANKFISLSIC